MDSSAELVCGRGCLSVPYLYQTIAGHARSQTAVIIVENDQVGAMNYRLQSGLDPQPLVNGVAAIATVSANMCTQSHQKLSVLLHQIYHPPIVARGNAQ